MTVHKMEDYEICHRIGRATGTGTYELTRRGNRREIMHYKETYDTPAGECEPKQWNQIMHDCIKVAGAEKLLTKIIEHCRTNCLWLKTDKDREEYALEIIAGRSYRWWKEFSTDGLSENTAFVFGLEAEDVMRDMRQTITK